MQEVHKFAQLIEKNTNEFAGKYGNAMGGERLVDFVPGITEMDVLSDTGHNLVDIDLASNTAATEARTYSLRQLAELFNVLLRRSGVQARVTKEEKATRVLEDKVEALE